MEPNLTLTQKRQVWVSTTVAGLPVKEKRRLLRQVRALEFPACANVFFPTMGVFGADVALGHILSRTILGDDPE